MKNPGTMLPTAYTSCHFYLKKVEEDKQTETVWAYTHFSLQYYNKDRIHERQTKSTSYKYKASACQMITSYLPA